MWLPRSTIRVTLVLVALSGVGLWFWSPALWRARYLHWRGEHERAWSQVLQAPPIPLVRAQLGEILLALVMDRTAAPGARLRALAASRWADRDRARWLASLAARALLSVDPGHGSAWRTLQELLHRGVDGVHPLSLLKTQ